ncbi:hypothetical protein VTO42DRAFT_6784 [Malbranchea cinnamomea]
MGTDHVVLNRDTPSTHTLCNSVSPILFTLFIQPMFVLGTLVRKRARMGYADDIALLSAGASLEDNIQVLQEDFKLLNSWAADEKLTFDTGKPELAHFPRRRCNNPAIELDTWTETHSNAVCLDGAVCYLGIWLDRKLSFRKHVDTMAAKARQVAGGIQACSNTVRGAPVPLLRQAVQACVLPILCYGTEAWWPGKSRVVGGREISNRVDSLVERLGEPAVRLDYTYRSTTSRARPRQEAPTCEARRQGSPHTPHTTRFTRTAKHIGATEAYDPLAVPPWAHTARKEDSQIGFVSGHTKEQAAWSFKRWLQRRNPLDLVVYTDGSQTTHPRRAAGAGWAICWGEGHPIVTTGNLSLPKAEVFDAEAVAAPRGLQDATTCFQARYASNVLIWLDNLEVARTLTSSVKTSSQQAFTQFQEAEKAWQTRERLPYTSKGRVIVRWVPGHAGVAGNEKADQEAKAAAARATGEGAGYTSLSKLLGSECTKRYTDLEIPLQKAPIEMKLPGITLGKLYASRTGHGDFADYHIRLNHADAELHCLCRHRKAPEHIFYCRLAKREATRRRQPAYNLREILATTRGAQEFNGWLNKTRFYKEICPMHRLTVTTGQMLQPNSNPLSSDSPFYSSLYTYLPCVPSHTTLNDHRTTLLKGNRHTGSAGVAVQHSILHICT